MEIDHIEKVFRTNCRDQLQIFAKCLSEVQGISEANKAKKNQGQAYSRLEEELGKWMKLYDQNCALVDKLHKEQDWSQSSQTMKRYQGVQLALATQTQIRKGIAECQLKQWPEYQQFVVWNALLKLNDCRSNNIKY